MRINLIPMAGEGQRFKNQGYTIPKPLLDIDGLPMVVRAAKSLPVADRYIFVCRKEHLDNSPIEEILKSNFDNPVIISVDHLTEGQAMTCMLARPFIPDDATLTIGASDNDMTYDLDIVQNMFDNNDVDGWIWTFRDNNSVLAKPEMYGWVQIEQTTTHALNVSCKVPISKNPIRDHAIIGAFTFKKALYFFDAVNSMVSSNTRINNEFYVDVAMNFVINAGLKIEVCEVEKYICWGTPADYELYLYWLHYFKRRLLHEK